MRKSIVTSILVFVLAAGLMVPSSARCEGVKFGVGVLVGNDLILESREFSMSLGSSFFTVPIVFEKFKIEPEFGFHRMSEEDESITMMKIGIGAGYRLNREDVTICLGAHFGMDRLSVDFGDSETFTGTYFGPFVEGEYCFGENFSIGGRCAFDFNMLDEEFEPDKIIETKTHGFLRWYF